MIFTRTPIGLLALTSLVTVFANVGCGRSSDAPEAKPAPPLYAEMETDKGPIEIELLTSVAPKTTENFKLLAERGYYNDVTFHRIVKNFMIQGGDPTGTGRGGESAWGAPFADEIDKTSPLYRDGYKRGSVAMANSGPNTNTSQFFILHKDFPLNAGYTIFGKVIHGMEVVDALAETPTTRGMDGNMSKPVTPPVIKKVTIRTTPLNPPEPAKK